MSKVSAVGGGDIIDGAGVLFFCSDIREKTFLEMIEWDEKNFQGVRKRDVDIDEKRNELQGFEKLVRTVGEAK